ncbi:unnamed protein product [Prorocentrum cordatum]|uniref:Peptidase S1 domain-containing protein n=1 Tax=Prorocentrum cordatum TaxID=2364126 RepID=A0ABN9WR98_9DINO|nr:unnamed protein product [Polarella glacialis]
MEQMELAVEHDDGVACLPSADVVGGEACFITGWGTLSFGGSQPDLLQEAQVRITSNAECSAAYGDGKITDGMVCAQGINDAGEVTDACQGDSGGPLVCATDGDAYVLHGATSWGDGCADARYPGVWARVNHVRAWIDELMGFTISPTPAPPPTPGPPPTPAPHPTPAPQHMWANVLGQCTLDGTCVQSLNYPQDYGTDQSCTVEIDELRAAPIVAVGFETEQYFDTVTVNGQAYSGTSGPSGVTPTTDLLWSSDFIVGNIGWRLCMPALTPAPPPAPAPEHMWASMFGPCELNGFCVQSPNYPNNYSAQQACTIDIHLQVAAPIMVESFYTELFSDILTVSGVEYSGNVGPSGITPTAAIVWTSDSSVEMSGWKLCMVESPVTHIPPTTSTMTTISQTATLTSTRTSTTTLLYTVSSSMEFECSGTLEKVVSAATAHLLDTYYRMRNS